MAKGEARAQYMAPRPYHRTAAIGGRMHRTAGKLAGQAEGLGDRERAQKLQAALQEVHGGPDRTVQVVDVFPEDGTVVFFIEGPEGSEPPGDDFFMSRFEEGDDGFEVGEPVRVVRRTTFEEVEPSGDGEAAGNVAGARRPEFAEPPAPYFEKAPGIAGQERESRPPATEGDAIRERTEELLAGLPAGDRLGLINYVAGELKRAGAC